MPCFWDVLHGCHFPGIADIGQTQMFFCYNCQTFLKIKRGKRSAEIDKKYLLLLTTYQWLELSVSYYFGRLFCSKKEGNLLAFTVLSWV